jgi:hypothetical protein
MRLVGFTLGARNFSGLHTLALVFDFALGHRVLCDPNPVNSDRPERGFARPRLSALVSTRHPRPLNPYSRRINRTPFGHKKPTSGVLTTFAARRIAAHLLPAGWGMLLSAALHILPRGWGVGCWTGGWGAPRAVTRIPSITSPIFTTYTRCTHIIKFLIYSPA